MTGPDSFVPAVPELKASGFTVHSTFWATLENDPQLRAELDRRIESRAATQVQVWSHELREKVIEEARREGHALGQQEGRQVLLAEVDRVQALCRGILDEKVELMQSHEREWSLALSHLMKRFLIPRAPEFLAGLSAWIEESLGVYAKTHKVKVFVCPDDYDAYSAVASSGSHWELAPDPSLSAGELRCECAGAGVFFSPQDEWARLDEVINRLIGDPKGSGL